MKFDRKAPGGGAEAICRLENGKLFLEWRFHFLENRKVESSGIFDCKIADSGTSGQRATIKITLTDRNGAVAAECLQTVGEEEPLETILMQPCLWQGIQEPCLYRLEASLTEKGKHLDRLYAKLPLRVIDTDKNGELLLNERPFTPRAVRYSLPAADSETTRQRLVMEDFQRLLKLGANSICLESICQKSISPKRICQESIRLEEGTFPNLQEALGFFPSLCDRFGFLLFVPQKTKTVTTKVAVIEETATTKFAAAEEFVTTKAAAVEETAGKEVAAAEEAVTTRAAAEEIVMAEAAAAEEFPQSNWMAPCYVCAWNQDIRLPYGEQIPLFRGMADSFFPPDSSEPTALYYQYRAKWSKKPFIYIVPESVCKLKSGNYTVTCYSSCGKTALYSDGILFEFREGAGELVFQEVPAKGPCIRLSAEGEGVSTSFSVHKSFLNFSPGY